MTSGTPLVRSLPWALLSLAILLVFVPFLVQAAPKEDTYWRVEDVRVGMKGVGRTVMKGTKIEEFSAEILGVLKNTSPGRDLVLARLSGLDLDKTGVIAGMSGSPVYINGKLLGAVAYAWPFGKEPIAGITPFSQMHGFVERFERRDLAQQKENPARIGLREPININGKDYDTVTVAGGWDDPQPTAADGLWLTPLQMPLATSNFSNGSLAILRDKLKGTGMIPVQGGGATGQVAAAAKEVPLQAGGPLALAMITGDFDLSGIGTVTHIEGERVYGWGHPFMSMGACEFPLMTGYIHTIYPRSSLSFKMGSPLRTVGVINADVSTCVAGWLGRTPDMLPMKMTVRRETDAARTFNVQLVRPRTLQAALVLSALANSIDTEGDLPEELTAELQATISVEGHPDIVINDRFSGPGFSGARAANSLYQQVVAVVNLLNFNSYKPVRIKNIETMTTLLPGRRTADIESIQMDTDTYAPGEELKATVFIRPYKELPQRLRVSLKLPADLPEGNYTATVCDDLANARLTLRDNPTLTNPQNIDQVFEAMEVAIRAKRTNLVVRVPVNDVGVAVGGKSLPSLPPSMVQILSNTRRTGSQTISGALVSRHPTDWVVQGSESIKFTVAKNKRIVNGD
jgi:hypothetical protein